jgi:hypothetical protein
MPYCALSVCLGIITRNITSHDLLQSSQAGNYHYRLNKLLTGLQSSCSSNGAKQTEPRSSKILYIVSVLILTDPEVLDLIPGSTRFSE